MPKVRYIGPARPGVDVPVGGQQFITFAHGEAVEVSDELAASLLVQDIWQAADDAPATEPDPPATEPAADDAPAKQRKAR